jgi:hypothetical protein
MSNNYSMEYGYQSLIYPARMFKTREDAEAFDGVESRTVLTGPIFTRALIEDIAKGDIFEGNKDNARVVLAALRWTLNAADDAARDKRMAEWREKEKENEAVQANALSAAAE